MQIVLCTACVSGAAARSLADLSLEELADVRIVSVGGRSVALGEAPASVFVVTAEAIRRAGASSLPEALRLAPNLQVAQITAAQYAISARGFNDAIANKLLVLVDGRTVYTPFYAGVFWDQQAVLVEDIERIEVISGPGAALWGANAVNGVINVITRSASATPGTMAMAQGGSDGHRVVARHGGGVGAAAYRVEAARARWSATETADGQDRADGWDLSSVGARVDWTGRDSTAMLQAQAYQVEGDPRPGGLSALSGDGAHVLANWTRTLGAGGQLSLQGYVDRLTRDDALLYRLHETVVDLSLRHAFDRPGHRFVWGLGYRQASDRIDAGLLLGFHPPKRRLRWSSVFAQDEIDLSSRVVLTAGIKAERNDYTGAELLPSLRLGVQLTDAQFVWTQVSRAVRAPARLDRDLSLPPSPPYIIAGGPDFVSEVANVFELGWRGRGSETVSGSITAFVHHWDRLRSGQLPPDAHVQNMISGQTHGLEAWATWQAHPRVRWQAGWTWLHEDLRVDPRSTDPVGPSALGNDPGHQLTLRASLDLAPAHELDIGLRHVGALPEPAVPAYTAVDIHYAWRVARALTLSLSVRNLFDDHHAEFGAATDRTDFRRSGMVRLTWAP